MISTFEDVRTRARHLLDDANGDVFTDAIFTQAFGEAWDVAREACNVYQIPLSKKSTTYTLPASTTSLTPATAGITGLGELIELEERLSGSSDNYSHVEEVDKLPQYSQTDELRFFVWEEDSFKFIGANVARQLRITWYDMPAAPTTGSIGVDGLHTFLALYSAGVMGPRKGYDDIGDRCMMRAVGPSFSQNIIGGALFRFIQPMVRARQHVQVAPRPFRAGARRRYLRNVPHVAAQLPVSGGTTIPAQFTSAGAVPTITGTMNGINDTFVLSYPVTTIVLYRNGSLLTGNGVDYTHAANTITFSADAAKPVSGDILTALGYI